MSWEVRELENILIVGAMDTIVETICKRLVRENNKVFLLTNKKNNRRVRGVKVYNYQYDSDSVYEVFGSCRPDRVLFIGAYDSNFTWNSKTEKQDYKNFTVGLSNVLRVAERFGVKRFIYISNGEVFEKEYIQAIPESTMPTAETLKATSISIGETLVKHYSSNMSLDTVIARIDNLYYCPKNYEECNNVYLEKCRKAVIDGEFSINTKITRSGIWINDAVQAVFTLLFAQKHNQQIYHITSGDDINQGLLANLISDSCTREVIVKDSSIGTKRVIKLRDSYFAEEFDFSARYAIGDCIPEVVQYIQKNADSFKIARNELDDIKDVGKSLLKKLFPYIEAIVVFALVMLVQLLFGDSNYFEKVDFFLLFITLFALIHGLNQAVFTGVLSMLGYFYLNVSKVPILELFMDVGTYVWLAQIFVIGMSVGYLKDNMRQMKEDKDEEIDYLKGRISDISEINDSTTEIKNYFENQVIGNKENLSFFYNIMTRLDDADDNGILFEVINVLQTSMATKDVAIYEASNGGYYRLLTSSSTRNLKKSLRLDDYEVVAKAIEKDMIFVNTTIDPSLPSMASCIKDEDGNVQIILCLWDLPFERMTLHYRNMFRLITLLVRSAVIRASKYLSNVVEKRFYPNTRVLNKDAFEEVKDIYSNAQERKLVQFITIKCHTNEMDEAQSHLLIQKQFRDNDVIGYYGDNDYVVLAVNSSVDDASIILNRLSSNGIDAQCIG